MAQPLHYTEAMVKENAGRYCGFYLLYTNGPPEVWAKTRSAKTAAQLVRVLGFRFMLPSGFSKKDSKDFLIGRKLHEFTEY